MSYNIDSVEILSNTAWMHASDVIELYNLLEASLPESNFLADMHLLLEPEEHEDWYVGQEMYAFSRLHPELAKGIEAGVKPNVVPVWCFWWFGEFSDTSYEDVLIKQIAPKIHSRIEMIFTWEGGDSVTGLIIDEGRATKMDVARALVPKKGTK